tara:strand:+ start:146 stop:676 length:531 start_codon:yes stop_codon:yes gene_type:complete
MLDFNNFKKKNICLMGLMGSGKSLIGRDLSNYLNIKFYDTDKEIELKAKKSINLIFSEEGESYFRDLEEQVCLELLKNNNCIISLGGGSIINRKIRQAIKLNSFSIYLKVNIDILLKRLKTSKKRPLLNNKKKETLERLYNERKEFYQKANLIVNNEKSKSDILKKIKLELNSYEK